MNDGHPVYALRIIRDDFAATRRDDTMAHGPQAVIIASGVPWPNDICSSDRGNWSKFNETTDEDVGRRVTREAVAGLADDGVKVFVLTAAPKSTPDPDNDELAKLGNTGHGRFSVETPEEITAAFEQMLHELISCDFELNGEVTAGHECEGEVSLDGAKLTCNTPDGWRMKDKDTLVLTGASCENLRAHPDAVLSARFPCEVWKGPD
jgi:hypothetical protein